MSLISCFLLVINVEATGSKFSSQEEKEKGIEKNHQKALKQLELKEKLDNSLRKQGVTEEDLSKEGGLYFNDNQQVVFQLKKIPLNEVKHGLLKKNFEDLIVSSNSEFQIQEVEYSQDELETIVKGWYYLNSDIAFTKNTFIRYDYLNNQVEVKTDKLDQKDQDILLKRFGNKIQLFIDLSYEARFTNVKSRDADWNKQGAGIGIQNSSNGLCTTAGVVRKDTRYFILTAGHCVGSIGTNVKQWDSLVGTAHLDAQSIDYDFGLVLVDKGTLTRYASNGLYINDANNPSDYDGRLRNYGTAVNGEIICKSGRTTGYTCGTVTSTSANILGQVNFEVRDYEEFMGGSGDSGSPGFRSANGYLVGILSAVSTDYTLDGRTYGYKGYFVPYKPIADKYGLTLYTSDTSTRILN